MMIQSFQCRKTVQCVQIMEGKTVIITGGNRGIGKETAKKIASEGARLILACRDLEAASEAAKEIIQESGNSKVIVKKLDVSSLKSVRAFAEDINKSEERLDVLLHNAGVIPRSLETTEDDLELTMATNHFGPFLLTHLLIDLLKKSAPSRILVTSSISYLLHTLDLENLSLRRLPWCKDPQMIYFDSKFANICFTKELAFRLQGTGVTANCFHPGIVDTEIWDKFSRFLRSFWLISRKLIFKTVEEGAETGTFLTTSERVEGVSGKYFADCREGRLWRRTNADVRRKLWERSEEFVKLSPSSDPKI